MVRFRSNRPLIYLAICLLVAQLFTSILSPIVAAQPAPSPQQDEATSADRIEGQELINEPKEEFYYWDMEKKDGVERPVLFGRGGLYTETVKFEPKEGEEHRPELYALPADSWLPIKTDQPWCGPGARVDINDGKSDVMFRIPDGRDYGTIDLTGDGDEVADSYEFKWTAIVDDSNPDDKKFINIKTGSNHNPADNESYEDCRYIFKESFHIITPKISPFEAVDPNNFHGKILGEKGVKFEDWLRRFNNLRDYYALTRSAATQTTIHCQKFEEREGCLSRLSIVFQKCYVRAIGIEDTTFFTDTAAPIMSQEEALEKFDFEKNSSSIWDHTIRRNLGPFSTCFGGNRYRENDKLDRAFQSEQEGIDFGEWIAYGAVFPQQLYPYDIDEVSDPSMPREKPETRCSLGKMGWILCPALKFFAGITDKLFNFIRQWLVVPPLLAGDGMAAFVAWKYMRDFANVVFVVLILALIIIYVTGGMLTSYNLRTILPRLIITGLLINISFYLCSFLVDVSNVAGSSLYSLIRDMTPPKSGVDSLGSWEAIVNRIAFAGGGALAAGGVMLVGLAALVPMLLTALISMIIVLLSLLLRQAVIIILVIVAPLAFALKLLPGTSNWFEKWKTMFMQMLFLYPAIAIVFSGAYFASNVIQGQSNELGDVLMAIFALAIQVIPLFLTPIIMKFGGGALNSFGGAIKSAVKSPADKINNAANVASQDRRDKKDTQAAYRRGLSGKLNPVAAIRRARMRRQHKYDYWASEAKRAQTERVAKSGLLRGIAMASGVGRKPEELDAILDQAAKERMRLKNIALDDQAANEFNHDRTSANRAFLENVKDSTDSALASASAQQIIDSGDFDAIMALLDTIAGLGDNSTTQSIRDAVATKIASSPIKNKVAALQKQETIQGIRDGTTTSQNLYQGSSVQEEYAKPSVAVREGAESIRAMQQHMNDSQLRTFVDSFHRGANDDKTSQYITPAAMNAVAEIERRLNGPRGGRG